MTIASEFYAATWQRWVRSLHPELEVDTLKEAVADDDPPIEDTPRIYLRPPQEEN